MFHSWVVHPWWLGFCCCCLFFVRQASSCSSQVKEDSPYVSYCKVFPFVFPISVNGTTIQLIRSPSQRSGNHLVSSLTFIPTRNFLLSPGPISVYLLDTFESIISSLLLFCLNYSNSLLTGLKIFSLHPLESRLHTSISMLQVET